MSTRWYPIYQKGSPQLRVFLPNFWMKLVKPDYEHYPKNHVKFIVSDEMSRLDVKNYLEKIYNVPVVNVNIMIARGKTKQAPKKNYIIKDDDYKVAYVTLPKTMQFEFPELFPEDKKNKDLDDEKKQLEQLEAQKKSFASKNKELLKNVPGWFV